MNIIGTERYRLAASNNHTELAMHLAQRYGWTYGYSKVMATNLINDVQDHIKSMKRNKIKIVEAPYGTYNHEEYIKNHKKEKTND